MSTCRNEAQSLPGPKAASGASEEILRDIWKANIKKREGKGLTQNKLEGPQSSKLCKTFKLKKKERVGKIARLIRQSLGGHWRAHVGKECRGYGMDCEGPPHAT